MLAHFRNGQLVATYAVGFGVLFNFICTFTYVSFHLAAAPYNLSSSALGAIFVVYLVGAALSPWIGWARSEEHTSELQSHRDLHSFPTRRSSDLLSSRRRTIQSFVQRARRDFRRLSGRRRALAMDRLG